MQAGHKQQSLGLLLSPWFARNCQTRRTVASLQRQLGRTRRMSNRLLGSGDANAVEHDR
jgi:hypothetical protein